MSETFIHWTIDKIVPGEPLPGPFFLSLEQRYVQYRAVGQIIDRNTYDRMSLKGVQNVFIREADLALFEQWVSGRLNLNSSDLPISESLKAAREDAHRTMMDIFHETHANEMVTKALSTSKNLVTEITKFPFATRPMSQLQTYSKGTVDHSVNVSVLAVYLAMNMGYSHVLILRHVAAGSLLHDIGKSQIRIEDSESPEVIEEKMREHPAVGDLMMANDESIPREVRMIIAQHHECNDGSGFPRGLRGKEIYDLARIVSIANVFDELVSKGQGNLEARQAHALEQIAGPLAAKFDPNKLKKVLKIMELGI